MCCERDCGVNEINAMCGIYFKKKKHILVSMLEKFSTTKCTENIKEIALSSVRKICTPAAISSFL